MVRDYYFIFTAKYAAFRVFYGRTAGIVPIIEVFVAKVIPIGTGIAFMMGIVGLSLPEATLLKKVMTWRLIGVFLHHHTVHRLTGLSFQLHLMRVFARGTGK